MTNDGWGNAWPDQMIWPVTPDLKPMNKQEWDSLKPIAIGWDLKPTSGTAINQIFQNAQAIERQLHKQGSNLVDDEGHLYFQCEGCEALFDPATKSFKTLHDFAHKQGWKIKWNTNGLGYKIYCVKCGD